jgi:hypothetical protein
MASLHPADFLLPLAYGSALPLSDEIEVSLDIEWA